MPITAAAKEQIRTSLKSHTTSTGLPGLVFCAIDRSGAYLAQEAAGQHSLSDPTPMSMDSVFWIASCTKLITTIACMQLVEQGKLDLDSHQRLYEICPELKGKKVLQEGKLVERKGEITARMLLAHTSGFGYAIFNERLRDWGRPVGLDELSGHRRDVMDAPLVNQPGSRWEYSVGLDWAGIAVERISGLSLDAYVKENIFEPLGIKNISFHPDEHMRGNLVGLHQRYGDKTIQVDHTLRRVLSDGEQGFESGGAGCFGRPSEYCQILATLLNAGTSPTTSRQILQPPTVTQMFTNQIPQFPHYGRQDIPASKPEYTNPIPHLYQQDGDPPQGWGLSFHMNVEPAATGRAGNGAYWAGIANLFWWCDLQRGVAGMCAGQIYPFGDADVMGAWVECEGAVYAGLEGARL